MCMFCGCRISAAEPELIRAECDIRTWNMRYWHVRCVPVAPVECFLEIDA